jgi:hypothetical protein
MCACLLAAALAAVSCVHCMFGVLIAVAAAVVLVLLLLL